jgi:hypothetical protein
MSTEGSAGGGRSQVRAAWWAVALLAALLTPVGWGPAPAPAAAAEVVPGENLCAAINALEPGQELLVHPGEYQGPCTIRRGGRPGAPIIVRASEPERRPRIVYAGSDANVIEVKADHVTLRGLAFGPTAHDVDGVRIFARAGITIAECEFIGLGGIAVAANHVSINGLTVTRNVIQNSGSTGMYFGCQEGAECVVSGLLVEGNFIRHVNAPDPEIGYGLQIKLNSTGIVRNNVILDTKGPGIMIYGARETTNRSLVERNVVVGSRTSSGIVVGGGPATVRNNILVQNREAGIGLEDYGGRGLLRSIAVVHNSLYRNVAAGISVPDGGQMRDVTIVNNAVHARGGTRAFPGPRPEIELAGNVDCTWAPCFVDPEGMDFSPLIGSLLSAPGSVRAGVWVPADDYAGVRRHMPPTVGAVEGRARPIRLNP